MSRIAITIVCLALVGRQALASPLAEVSAVVAHPHPSATLDASQIKATLEKVTFESDDVAELVAKQVYAAKDKTAELTQGVSSRDLIEANSVNLSACSAELMKGRLAVLGKVTADRREAGLNHALRTYLLDALLSVAQFCTNHRPEVSGAGVAEPHWLDGLEVALRYDSVDAETDAQTIGRIAHEEVWNGFVTNVERFIETGSNEL